MPNPTLERMKWEALKTARYKGHLLQDKMTKERVYTARCIKCGTYLTCDLDEREPIGVPVREECRGKV